MGTIHHGNNNYKRRRSTCGNPNEASDTTDIHRVNCPECIRRLIFQAEVNNPEGKRLIAWKKRQEQLIKLEQHYKKAVDEGKFDLIKTLRASLPDIILKPQTPNKEVFKLPAKITVETQGGGIGDPADVTSIKIDYPEIWFNKEDRMLFETAKDFINNAKVTVILEINR